MRIKFWGVRGSIASPGQDTATIGGNTSCVEVQCGDERIILDAGTGLRGLGNAMLREGKGVDVTLLLSHFHWDHIQGLPFFVPVYMQNTRMCIVGGANGVMSVKEALGHQMQAPVFPVRLDEVGAKIETRDVRAGEAFSIGKDVRVRAVRLNHPGGVYAYRVDFAGRSVVYATDTEHYACVDPVLRSLADGADALIYDAQYTPEEYANKVGWGHSTYVAGVELARAAGVKSLVLFHHDPTRDDAGVIEVESRARAMFEGTIAAREGLEIDLSRSPAAGSIAA